MAPSHHAVIPDDAKTAQRRASCHPASLSSDPQDDDDHLTASRVVRGGASYGPVDNAAACDPGHPARDRRDGARQGVGRRVGRTGKEGHLGGIPGAARPDLPSREVTGDGHACRKAGIGYSGRWAAGGIFDTLSRIWPANTFKTTFGHHRNGPTTGDDLRWPRAIM